MRAQPVGVCLMPAVLSDLAGSGACYLTCHGVDHNPLGYGVTQFLRDAVRLRPPRAGIPVPPPLTPRAQAPGRSPNSLENDSAPP